jgi:hypothetical protein
LLRAILINHFDNKNMQPIELDFKPSPYLSSTIIAFAIAVSSIVIAVIDAGQWKWGIVFVILSYTAYILCLQALFILPWSYTGIAVNSKNAFYVQCKNGEKISVVVQGSSVVTPYLTIIHLRLGQNDRYNNYRFKFWLKRQVVVMPDLVTNIEAYRKIRVWLRWGAARP